MYSAHQAGRSNKRLAHQIEIWRVNKGVEPQGREGRARVVGLGIDHPEDREYVQRGRYSTMPQSDPLY
ncbi:hypothetical protein AGABI1DRAFT_87230 [Agaricus bisporus var. burnettii JB137-S8]|uniref:Uncharacterized protein n=1 Tax=Agaricus bisporus var. burnettii (strain JB137-S8 / ATCC MYA-4627 / FGSC 10392) TaxID=597362 RepID=K5XP84_AGABU|nr:uncharacterized protein AGABI1DRAFT_87230 [Agaricus bisporus var. burnettii JB137-S8]EKM76505.1 hypothetical protein AGABI1DRAFT_87230 [Agaricus bisporus var. burnettii JB137-S8]